MFCVGGLLPAALLAGGAAANVAAAPQSVSGAPVTPPASPLDGVGYTPVTSARLLDTRPTGATIDDIDEGGGPLAANTTRTIAIADRGGVPATGVDAVVLHVTAVQQTARTYVTVWPSELARPTTSNLNPVPGAPASNLVIVKLGAAGDVSLYNFTGSVNLIVDVVGYFPTGPVFDGLGPDRVLDTRLTSDPIGPGETIELQLAGIVGVPATGVEAVALNVTAVGATARTFVTVHPLDSQRPPTSNLNAAPGTVAANHVIAELGTDGKISIYNDSGNVHVIVDVMGWFADGPGYTTVSPTRLIDTRPGSPLGPNSTLTIPLAGNAGLPPAGLGAVVFNLTAVDATSATFLTVFPGGATRPDTSDLNPRPGVVAPNLVIAEVGADGTVQLYNSSGTVDVLVDIVGWMPSNVVATDDAATVAEDAAATAIDVTVNDDDFDGGPLLVQAVTQPANGTVTISGGGTTVSYTPDEDYCNDPPGTTLDTFTYTLYGESTATVVVTVTCVDDAPTTDDDSATVLEDSGATTISVLANDDDIDGGPMTVDSVTQPDNGTAVITGGGTGLSYAPDADYCNSPPATALDTFTYTLNGGDEGTVSVTVTCVNDVPSFTKGADESVLEDAGAQSVAGWATAISAGPANESTQTLAFTVTGNDNEDLFSVAPAVSSTGALTYTPAANANGEATITIELSDDGGTTDGGVDTSATQSFLITVGAVNDVPSFTKGADQSVLEDAGAQTVSGWATSLSAGPADESGQALSFTVTGNTNTGLFSAGPVVSSTGELTYTPAANANGVATISVAIEDDGGTSDGGVDVSATQSFTITVGAVNDVPSFTKGADESVLEDAGAQTVSGWATAVSAGPADESGQTLTFAVTGNTNEDLFSVAPAVSAAGELTYTPAADANGVATITLELADNGGIDDGGVDTSATQSFTITVGAVNDVPSFTKGSGESVLEDSGAQTVPGWATDLSAGPADESGQTLSFTITGNTNEDLFAAGPAVSSTGQLTFTPAANANGSATVSVAIVDDGGTANGGDDTSDAQSFTISVGAVNDTPSFDLPFLPDQAVVQDSPEQTVAGFASNISAGPPDEAAQELSFVVTNDYSDLFTVGGQPAIDATTGDLTYTPEPGVTGSATVTVALNDNGGTANGGDDDSDSVDFTITVFPPNDVPVAQSQTGAGAVDTLEDDDVVITLTATDGDDEDLTFSIVDAPTSGSLGPIGAVDCTTTPNTCTATVTYTPDSNSNGLDSFTFTANDGSSDSNTATVEIDVTPVNDVPSFTKGADQTVLEDSGAQTVAGWATGISKGPADEAAQTLTFNVTNNTNAALFSAGPAIAANGTLTYTPAANANGSATITIELEDDGLTANGGVDTSATQTFTITVTPVNDVPSFTKGADQSVNEDAGAQSAVTWATAISKGPADEAGQTLTFNVTNNTNTSLFSAGPSIAANGTLTYTPAVNQHGTATITIELEDNGGVANGGVDTSATQSFVITVNAINDAPTSDDLPYTIQSNMQRSVTADIGLLSDAADAADVAGDAGYTPTFTVGEIEGNTPVSETITAVISGVGTVVADATTGAFTIDPAPGVTGPVEFDFELCDDGDGTPASQCITVTADITIDGPVIWFVNPAAVTNGTGTLTSPFNTLAAADTVDLDGHRVFVYNGTTATGLELNDDEWLIGQSATGTFDTFFGITPPTGTSTRPTMGFGTTTIGGTVTLATNAKVQGVAISTGTAAGLVGSGGLTGITVSQTSVTTTTGTAVNLNNAVGTYTLTSVITNGAANGILLDSLGSSAVTVTGGSIVNASTRGIDINSGTGNFSYGGTITTTSAGRSVEITNRTGGTVAFTGEVTDAGLGINLATNTGTTINFSGGITVSSGANPAFAATGGGTVNVTGTNTLATTTGTALNVTNTTIGASGITFRSISANGGVNGIVLNNTGTSGSLTVTGNGGTCASGNTAGCSGGEIRNTTGADNSTSVPGGTGIVLNNTLAPSFTRMYVHDHSNYGIRGTSVAGFTLASSVIEGTNGSNAAGPYRDSSIAFDNLTGSASVTSTFISGGAADNLRVENSSGTLNRLTLSSVTIGTNGLNGNDGVLVGSTGTATIAVTVQNSTFTAARGDLLQFNHGGSGTGDLVLTGNAFSNNYPLIATGGGGLTLGSDGTAGATTMNITNNTFRNAVGNALTIVKSTGPSTQTGTFSNNAIGVAGTPNSGSTEGSGLKLQSAGQGTLSWTVTNNTIRGYNNHGIEVLAGGGASAQSGTITTTITGNTIAEPGNTAGVQAFPKNGIHFNIGTVPGDSYQVCAVIGGAGGLANSIATAGLDAVPTSGAGDIDIRLRQRQSTTISLPGYAGATSDNGAVAAFLIANNSGNGAPVPLVANTVPTGGGFTGAGCV